MTKRISIDEASYDRLERLKREGETHADVIARLLGTEDIGPPRAEVLMDPASEVRARMDRRYRDPWG